MPSLCVHSQKTSDCMPCSVYVPRASVGSKIAQQCLSSFVFAVIGRAARTYPPGAHLPENTYTILSCECKHANTRQQKPRATTRDVVLCMCDPVWLCVCVCISATFRYFAHVQRSHERVRMNNECARTFHSCVARALHKRSAWTPRGIVVVVVVLAVVAAAADAVLCAVIIITMPA